MKVDALMIGFWVTGKKWRENPFKLTRINDNGKYCYGITSDGTQVGPFLLEEIEPVPLTPEILEKNGFKLENYSGKIMSGKWWTRNDFVIHERMNDSVGKNNFSYEYVHQLQHALRLCGIETEIEL